MKNLLFIFSIVFLLFSCTKKEDPEPIPDPTAAILIFPYENSECNQGTNVTLTESTVLFEWNEALYTDEYELSIKNLLSGVITTYTTSEIEYSAVLLRATPYQWFVTSKSNAIETTAGSAVWRFYNAGDAIEFHVPFPAEIISPSMAEIITTGASEITLDWVGLDLDDDIIGFDVYFGTSNPPSLLQLNVQESIIDNVAVTSDTIYYWYVITRDAQGNSSNSGVFQFEMD